VPWIPWGFFVCIFSRPSLAVTAQCQSSALIVRGKIGCRMTPPVSQSLACTMRTPSSLFPIETTKRVSGRIPCWVVKAIKVQILTKLDVSALTNSILWVRIWDTKAAAWPAMLTTSHGCLSSFQRIQNLTIGSQLFKNGEEAQWRVMKQTKTHVATSQPEGFEVRKLAQQV